LQLSVSATVAAAFAEAIASAVIDGALSICRFYPDRPYAQILWANPRFPPAGWR
jgi:hypothetical protein